MATFGQKHGASLAFSDWMVSHSYPQAGRVHSSPRGLLRPVAAEVRGHRGEARGQMRGGRRNGTGQVSFGCALTAVARRTELVKGSSVWNPPPVSDT